MRPPCTVYSADPPVLQRRRLTHLSPHGTAFCTQMDKERQVFNLKEAAFAQSIAFAVGADKGTESYSRLVNWRKERRGMFLENVKEARLPRRAGRAALRCPRLTCAHWCVCAGGHDADGQRPEEGAVHQGGQRPAGPPREGAQAGGQGTPA